MFFRNKFEYKVTDDPERNRLKSNKCFMKFKDYRNSAAGWLAEMTKGTVPMLVLCTMLPW